MLGFFNKNKFNTILLISACSIMVYVILRAYFVDITDDEAWSFYNVKEFWYVEALCTGNTHWFNFAAIKIALLLGFEKVYYIRWFSVLCGIGLIFITYVWIKTISEIYFKVFAFCFLLLNPYLIEYLSLARGYASALFFLGLSLWFMVKAQSQNKKFEFLSLCFAGFSAIANFNFLYFFVAFWIVYFYQLYFRNGFQFFKKKRFYIDSILSVLVVLIVLKALWFIKQCSNDIGSYGGEELVPSVFYSFINTLFYTNLQLPIIFKKNSAYFIFSLVMIASLFGVLKDKSHLNNLYKFSSLILLLMLVFMVLNKWCFGVLYPTERTSLMFYPLITIIITCFLQFIFKENIFKKAVIYLLSCVLLFCFIWNINFKSGYDHSYCEDSASYFEQLNKLNPKKVGIPLELYCVFVKYYRVTNCHFNAESVNTFNREVQWIKHNKLSDFDYLLLLPPYNLDYYKNCRIGFKAVRFFPETKAIILKVE